MTATKRSEPWHRDTPAPRYYLLVDEITARALAEGVVTVRLQAQAYGLTHYLDTVSDGLYAVVSGGDKEH